MTGLELVVTRSAEVVPGVRELVLARPDGGPLPAHPAGSHVVAECGERRNAYSLTNGGAEPREYAVAVLRRPGGRGGSAWLHERRPGDPLVVSAPRCAFAPVLTARRHLLVAGGIGITPMLAHVRDAVRWNRDVELLYAHRPDAPAYAADLDRLLGERLRRTSDRREFRGLLGDALRRQPLGTHLYVCGPAPLMELVTDTAEAAGWPAQRVHRERFTAAEVAPGTPFTARLRRSGRDVAVAAGTTLLDALHAAGVAVPSMCRQGVCGECRVPVLAGQPQHRDEYLDEHERAAGTCVLPCVSRSETGVLEVDL
ncbi:PDR/VanB family oxidoreductase [Prauserella flavalba]|nr:PDR/VanB family oxidoreductase [Prauserella flavalba]